MLVGTYGAAANALYPIAVAHANDFAKADEFVKVSGGLLLLFGIGTIIGPTLGGPVMTAAGPYALFAVTAVSHLLISAYAIYRSRTVQRSRQPIAKTCRTCHHRLANQQYAGGPQPRPACCPLPDQEEIDENEPMEARA